VEHVIIAKPLRKAFSMHVQMVGRAARPHEGKQFAVVQDHAGNWLRFIEDWDKIYEDGTKELNSDADTKTRKEKTKDQKEQAKCPKCSALWPVGSDTCTNCGHTRQRRSLLAEMPGIIEELSAKAKKDDKQIFWAMCQYKVQFGGWNPGRAAHLYKDKFGVWPRGLSDSPAMPDIKFEKFVKSRVIAYLKSKNRGVAA
jgi:superfamily II DNA or RNA helicase